MDEVRVGRILRALRLRRGWRQLDLASEAGCHQTTVSLVERGHLDTVALRTLRALFAAVDARVEATVTWRGVDLDRLLDRRHAALVEAAAAAYVAAGWNVHPEVSYARYGERGSIDLLAVHPASRTVAINEMKSDVGAVEDTIRKHDEKVRLAPHVCFERFGWRPSAVGRVLVLPEDAGLRRLLARHGTTFAGSYPSRSRVVRRWIRAPEGTLAGIWFLSLKDGGRTKRERSAT